MALLTCMEMTKYYCNHIKLFSVVTWFFHMRRAMEYPVISTFFFYLSHQSLNAVRLNGTIKWQVKVIYFLKAKTEGNQGKTCRTIVLHSKMKLRHFTFQNEPLQPWLSSTSGICFHQSLSYSPRPGGSVVSVSDS